MNNILKSLCLLGLLAGSTLALTPEEKLDKMNNAFADAKKRFCFCVVIKKASPQKYLLYFMRKRLVLLLFRF